MTYMNHSQTSRPVHSMRDLVNKDHLQSLRAKPPEEHHHNHLSHSKTMEDSHQPVSTQTENSLVLRIGGIDRKFRKACSQIVLLNNEIEALQARYNRTMKNNRRSFRYSIRLRLATLEGIRNMFYEYASRMADELEELQERVVVEEAEAAIVRMEDSDYEDILPEDDEETL